MVQTRQSPQQAVNGSAIGHTNGSASAIDSSRDKTDRLRWRLLDESGRHTWHYLKTDKEIEDWPQTTADKYHLGLPTV